MSVVVAEKRCAVLLGKSGAGKSTIANQVVGYDPLSSNVPPFEQGATHDIMSAEKKYTKEGLTYEVTVIDTVGLFDPNTEGRDPIDKIVEYFKKHIIEVSILLFVFRKGRMTDEEKKVFSLLESRLVREISQISALIITGCENLDAKARNALVEEFKGNPETKPIAAQMMKGIYPVGFPDITGMNSTFQEVYKAQIAKDRQTLMDLVFEADKPHDTKKLFLAIEEASVVSTGSSSGKRPKFLCSIL